MFGTGEVVRFKDLLHCEKISYIPGEMVMTHKQYKNLMHLGNSERKCYHARQSMDLKHYIKKLKRPRF